MSRIYYDWHVFRKKDDEIKLIAILKYYMPLKYKNYALKHIIREKDNDECIVYVTKIKTVLKK